MTYLHVHVGLWCIYERTTTCSVGTDLQEWIAKELEAHLAGLSNVVT